MVAGGSSSGNKIQKCGGEKQRTHERMRVAERTKPAQRSALADDILCCFGKSTDVCAITRKCRAKRRAPKLKAK